MGSGASSLVPTIQSIITKSGGGAGSRQIAWQALAGTAHGGHLPGGGIRDVVLVESIWDDLRVPGPTTSDRPRSPATL